MQARTALPLLRISFILCFEELKDCSDDVRDRTEKIKKDFKDVAQQIAVA